MDSTPESSTWRTTERKLAQTTKWLGRSSKIQDADGPVITAAKSTSNGGFFAGVGTTKGTDGLLDTGKVAPVGGVTWKTPDHTVRGTRDGDPAVETTRGRTAREVAAAGDMAVPRGNAATTARETSHQTSETLRGRASQTSNVGAGDPTFMRASNVGVDGEWLEMAESEALHGTPPRNNTAVFDKMESLDLSLGRSQDRLGKPENRRYTIGIGRSKQDVAIGAGVKTHRASATPGMGVLAVFGIRQPQASRPEPQEHLLGDPHVSEEHLGRPVVLGSAKGHPGREDQHHNEVKMAKWGVTGSADGEKEGE